MTEQVIGGAAFVRVDVPGTGNGCPGFTKFLGNNAIYAMTPVSEEAARAVVQRYAPKPIVVYMPELALPAKSADLEADMRGDDDICLDCGAGLVDGMCPNCDGDPLYVRDCV